MAKATVVRSEPAAAGINLELSLQEAKVLFVLVGTTMGSTTKMCHLLDRIYGALSSTGMDCGRGRDFLDAHAEFSCRSGTLAELEVAVSNPEVR